MKSLILETDFCRFSGTDVQQVMATVMKCHVDVSPEHLGVNSKLTLTDASDATTCKIPYSSVVDVLKTAPDLVSPVMKLDAVSKYCRVLPRTSDHLLRLML